MDPLDLVRWAAALCTIAAALMVAWGEPARLVAWGFVLFTVAALLWIGASVADGKADLLAQNVVLLGVNLWGVWRWWRRI
ncbi:hypothetical protein MWU52_12550 [Jannaschia sp. S6380]|uniref:hypothetical protein n=1 Tax=Jannaschia sp. S6380 TaxID=2926408 RepID=UPI001FF13C36|nr:hypothetical protein [Jannaschia sp. S6380]MCK0168386.1 hypothetical protein [Jannaschia sp. S6380]